MRICHICSNYDNFFNHFMNEQIKQGLTPRVFFFRAKEKGLPNNDEDYVDIRLNYRNWHRMFFYLKSRLVLTDFLKLYSKNEFNLMHAHTLFSNGYIAFKIKKYWGLPYIVAVRATDVGVFFKYRKYLHRLGLKILLEAENVIFLSPTYRNDVISKYIPKKYQEIIYEKSIVIPNGIDSFYLNNKYYRNNVDINKKNIRILTVGYICKRKNQIKVCEAIKKLNKSGYNISYTIVGKILNKRIFNKINKYPFVNYIPFLPKEKLINIYRESDIYVMPSINETFGLTYAEAMSQGLPVIYTKGQGFDQQFMEGQVGYHVKYNDVDDIMNKIIKVINNYYFLSLNSVKLVDKFDWTSITEQYINLYKEIIN